MWEDDKNRRGGRWLINLDKKQRISCLDNFWLEVMLCLIGEENKKDLLYFCNSVQQKVKMGRGGVSIS